MVKYQDFPVAFICLYWRKSMDKPLRALQPFHCGYPLKINTPGDQVPHTSHFGPRMWILRYEYRGRLFLPLRDMKMDVQPIYISHPAKERRSSDGSIGVANFAFHYDNSLMEIVYIMVTGLTNS
jgi:hypothetical protein